MTRSSARVFNQSQLATAIHHGVHPLRARYIFSDENFAHIDHIFQDAGRWVSPSYLASSPVSNPGTTPMSPPSGSPIHPAHPLQPQILPIPRCLRFSLPPLRGRRVQKSSSIRLASLGGSARLFKSSSTKISRLFTNLTSSSYGALLMPSVVISAEASSSCKPNQAQTILSQNGMTEALDGKLLISILAGVTISQLTAWVPPTTKVVRAMPNTPCRVRAPLLTIPLT